MADNLDHDEDGAAEGVEVAPDVKARVGELKKFQAEFKALEKQKHAEFKALELKYEALFQNTFAARKAIVSGEVEAPDCPPDSTSKGIPSFWLDAMKNSRTLAEFIETRDEPALVYLTDIASSFLPEAKGFALSFTFAPNPYFEETTLTKTFHMKSGMFNDEDEDEEEDNKPEGEEELEGAAEQLEHETGVSKIEGCDITWKAGKNLTVEIQTKKGKGGRGKKAKPVKKEVQVPSFFRFFETPDMAAVDQEDDEAMNELLQSTAEEVRVGFYLREELIPRALGFYLGEEEDEDEDGEDGGEDGDEDEEDAEEDEEEEDEEEEERPRRGKGGKGKGGKAAGGGGGGGGADSTKALTDAFKTKLAVAPPPVPGSSASAGAAAGAAAGASAADPAAPAPECKQQ